MALDLKINPDFKDRRVSHDKVNAKTIGDHTQPELLQLAIMARASNNPVLLECFLDLPIMDELVKTKTNNDIQAVKDNTVSKAVSADIASKTADANK